MKAEHVNPFLKSTIETFKTMVGLNVTPGKLFLRKEPHNADISGVIGLSGDIRGAVVMAYPAQTALKISSKFLAEDIKELNNSVADCVGEITNIITGFAKKDLQHLHLSISLPSIVRGSNHVVDMPKEAPVMCIPFSCECGDFIMEVSMVEKK
jgi:chemotaxis protein CheX